MAGGVLKGRGEEAPGVPARAAMHWAPDHGLPICGASKRQRWTLELAHATCSRCRWEGALLLVQYNANTR